ncbi:hypothetical protein HDU93_005538, partial [Gonapodya sp. JEL0774]
LYPTLLGTDYATHGHMGGRHGPFIPQPQAGGKIGGEQEEVPPVMEGGVVAGRRRIEELVKSVEGVEELEGGAEE